MTSGPASGTEVAVFGTTNVGAIRATVDAYARERLGSGVRKILFRAGRVDAVWAVRLEDHREVVVKAHRQPVDLPARLATVHAQRFLERNGFPCPVPVADTSTFRDLVVSTESLLTEGRPGDVHDPAVRLALARGLADHVRLLRGVPSLVKVTGCRTCMVSLPGRPVAPAARSDLRLHRDGRRIRLARRVRQRRGCPTRGPPRA